MFTGIILELGKVEDIQAGRDGARLCIKCPQTIKESNIGDSISINGVCLTITDIRGETACFDASQQTLNLTTTGMLKSGDFVNIEPALRVNSRLGGHFVSGHVEDKGRILLRRQTGNAERIDIEAPASILQYTIPKGSIAIDGISLTVVDVQRQFLSVVIIPHTLKMTTLGTKRIGEAVNLEPDMLAKYVAHFVSNIGSSDRDNKLVEVMQRAGYL